jgi:hypothetical protein
MSFDDGTDGTDHKGSVGGRVKDHEDGTADAGVKDESDDIGMADVAVDLKEDHDDDTAVAADVEASTQGLASTETQFFAAPGGIVIVESGTQTFVPSSAPAVTDVAGVESVVPVVPPAGLTGSSAQEGGAVTAAPAPAATGTGGDADRGTTAVAILAGFATLLGAGWALVGRQAVRARNR